MYIFLSCSPLPFFPFLSLFLLLFSLSFLPSLLLFFSLSPCRFLVRRPPPCRTASDGPGMKYMEEKCGRRCGSNNVTFKKCFTFSSSPVAVPMNPIVCCSSEVVMIDDPRIDGNSIMAVDVIGSLSLPLGWEKSVAVHL